MKYVMTICGLAILCLLTFSVRSQDIENYTFSASSGTFTPLSGATTMELTAGSLDDGYFNVVPIGFTFTYMGVPYTSVAATTNGCFVFGQFLSNSMPGNDLNSGTPRPIIAPLWDNLKLNAYTDFSYLTTGSWPNFIFTAQWLNVYWQIDAASAVISFQVKLYEATGVIEFIYREETGAVSSGSASIGISAVGSGPGNFLSLDGTSSSPSVSSTTETTTISTRPVTGQVYAFTPVQYVTPEAPVTMTFSAVTISSMTINWIDDSNTETYFIVSRSDDLGSSYPYTYMVPSTTTAATGNTYSLNISGLTVNTLYYFRITANNEGGFPSSPLEGSQATSAGTLQGIINIPGLDYLNLTQAFADVNEKGLSDDIVLVLLGTYNCATETYPIVCPLPNAVGDFNVTVWPDVPGISIISDHPTGTLDFNGCRNIIFNGSEDGDNVFKYLFIENTNTSGFAMRFINDAVNNKVKYCRIKGVTTNPENGVVLFSTTDGQEGNDCNKISNCDIGDGMSTPINCVYGAGTNATSGQYNNYDTIVDCDIFNFYHPSNNVNGGIGVNLGDGNADWYICCNHFYQTSDRTSFGSGATVNGILLSSTDINNMELCFNHIGGTTSWCGSTPWVLGNSSADVIFRGIQATAGTDWPTYINSNRVGNIQITTTNSSVHAGILLLAGSFELVENFIGNVNGNGSIDFVLASPDTTAVFSGVHSVANGMVGIWATFVKEVYVSTSSTGAVTTYGIFAGNSASYHIEYNSIGAWDLADAVTNSTNKPLIGIYIDTNSPVNGVIGNSICNITHLGTSTSNPLRGIWMNGINSGAFVANYNQIFKLTSFSSIPGTGSSASIIGISLTYGFKNIMGVWHNQIDSLINLSPTAPVGIIGIYYNDFSNGNDLVESNRINNLILYTSSSSGFIEGIMANGGTVQYQNNMVAIGHDLSKDYSITGIHDAGGTNTYYFNSVFISGHEVDGANPTYAFYSVTTNSRIIKDNIFFNSRANSISGAGKHYAVRYAGTVANPPGLTSDFNLFRVDGEGGVMGYYNSADISTMAQWRLATQHDNNSISEDPVFMDPECILPGAAYPDIHIDYNSATPVERAGTPISTVYEDYDTQPRDSYTPSDIGADCDFFQPDDESGPLILYTPLIKTGSTSDRNLADVLITDATGVEVSTFLPRIYYKRSTDGNVLISNSSASDGWKWTEANVTSSPFDFTIDYSLLSGGSGVAVGDIIQYFVIAQDIQPSPKIGVNNCSFASGPLSVDLTAAAFPVGGIINSYFIVNVYTGIVNIGTGQTFTSLTANSSAGFFKAVNDGVLTGNVTANVVSDLVETGEVALYEWLEEGSGNYTLTIQPSTTVLRTISGNYAGGLIRFNGADYVTIDGTAGASDGTNYFTITNTATSGTIAAIQLVSLGIDKGAHDITLRNCNISSGSGSNPASFGISSGGVVPGTAGSDHDALIIDQCDIYKAYTGIYVGDFNSFTYDDLAITTNRIGSVNIAESVQGVGIALEQVKGLIEDNEIFNIQSSAGTGPVGIKINAGVINSTFSRNKIHDIQYNGSGSYGGMGIYINTGNSWSDLTFDNNLIYAISGKGSEILTDMIIGIGIFGQTGWLKFYFNTVNLSGTIDRPGATSDKSACLSIGNEVTDLDLLNNIFVNTMVNTSGVAFAYAIYCKANGLIFSPSDYNDYYASGPEGMLGYLGSNISSLAAWEFATWPNDWNSLNADPLFKAADNLRPVPGSPVIGAGSPVGGIDYDYVNDDRDDSSPSMGAYENPPGNFALWTGNSNSAWNEALNWDILQVPDQANDVAVPSNPASDPDRFPVIGNGVNVVCDELFVAPGATVTIQDGGSLEIKNLDP